MDWIKKHTDQFALALLALILLALSVLIFLKTQGFAEGFAAAMTSPPHSKEIPPVDTTKIETAQKQFAGPANWIHKPENGSLFVSYQMMLSDDGQLKRAEKGFVRKELPGGGTVDVPNEWLLKYGFDVLSKSVLDEDPDRDGFTNLDEYLGEDRAQPKDDIEKIAPKDATDPKNKDSHPPYYTKLFLKQWIKIPFLLLFQSVDFDVKNPKDTSLMSFQINSRGKKTEFLKLGETVANSKFKLLKYEEKKRVNEKTGDEEDISELTLLNTETNDQIVLIKDKQADSPDSYGLFWYFWPDANKPEPIQKKRVQEFSLKPNTQEIYKLIDIKGDGAVIRLPGGEKTYNVPPVPKSAQPAAPAKAPAKPN